MPSNRAEPVSLSEDSVAHSARVLAALIPRSPRDDLTPTGDYAVRLQQDVAAYVVSRRESGETPERVYVELKAMRPHGETIAAATWFRMHDEMLKASLMDWFLNAFYSTTATVAPS